MVRSAIESQIGSLTARNIELEVMLHITTEQLTQALARVADLQQANGEQLD